MGYNCRLLAVNSCPEQNSAALFPLARHAATRSRHASLFVMSVSVADYTGGSQRTPSVALSWLSLAELFIAQAL